MLKFECTRGNFGRDVFFVMQAGSRAFLQQVGSRKQSIWIGSDATGKSRVRWWRRGRRLFAKWRKWIFLYFRNKKISMQRQRYKGVRLQKRGRAAPDESETFRNFIDFENRSLVKSMNFLADPSAGCGLAELSSRCSRSRVDESIVFTKGGYVVKRI